MRHTMAQTNMLDQINEHLKNEQFRNDRLWMMRGGEFVTEVDGKLMNEADFNTMFPPYCPLTYKVSKGNIDSTTAWLRK